MLELKFAIRLYHRAARPYLFDHLFHWPDLPKFFRDEKKMKSDVIIIA